MIHSHFIGREPDKTPYMSSSATDNSWAVVQWMELLRGERRVQLNSFHVVAVKAEEHYCLKCLVVRNFDVIYGTSNWLPVIEIDLGMDVNFAIKRCRVCGKQSVR